MGIVGLMLPAMGATATAAPGDAAPTPWRVIDLGAGDNSSAEAINDHGHVVGKRGDGTAFLWRDGRFTDLGKFSPTDINNRNEVAGYRREGDNVLAVLWRAGTLTDLGTLPGGEDSQANAVNDSTVVTGWSRVADGGIEAFRWRDGVMTRLGAGRAYDINKRGQIVGDDAEMNSVAVRWWRGMRTPLMADFSVAQAINRHGAVTGSHQGSAGSGSFVWQRGSFIAIPPPADDFFPFLQAYGINGRTQVVGSSSSGGFVWEAGTVTILPALSVRPGSANDINEDGVIAGASPTTTEGLVDHAVIWTR